MRHFTSVVLALALPWLLLVGAFSFWSTGNRNNLRLAKYPQQHAHILPFDLNWKDWMPFHHFNPKDSVPQVRLLGTGDSFSEQFIDLAQRHLPSHLVPHFIETRAVRGLESTANASLCLISEVDSGQYTDFLLVNVERIFHQIGLMQPDCDPVNPIIQLNRPSVNGVVDNPPPNQPPSHIHPWRAYMKCIAAHSIRDVIDFFWTNIRRACFDHVSRDSKSFKMRGTNIPMSCGLNPGKSESDHLFLLREELNQHGTDTTGFAATFNALRSLKAACLSKGMRFHMILVPDMSTVFAPWLNVNPKLVDPGSIGDAYYRHVFSALEASDVFEGPKAGELVNALDIIHAYHLRGGKNAYTHGDTHWSATGAGLVFRVWLRRVLPELTPAE